MKNSKATPKATLALLIALLSGCASSYNAWPRPRLTYFNATAPLEATTHHANWLRQPNHWSGFVAKTGSMLPYIHGGNKEILLYKTYSGEKLEPGTVACFKRQTTQYQYDYYGTLQTWTIDDPYSYTVLHMIVEVSKDGRYVLTTGTNTHSNDGWQPTSGITGILVEIITLPK